MSYSMKFKRDIELDAVMVHASMLGLFEPCAISQGMSPNEAYARAYWLKRQPIEYIEKVSNRVVELENGSLEKK